MKTKVLLMVLALLPAYGWTHSIAIPHTHTGILNGWESLAIFGVSILVIVYLVNILLKRRSYGRKV